MTTTQPNLFDFPEPEPDPLMICPTCSGHGLIRATAATSRTTDRDTAAQAGKRHATDVRRFGIRSLQARILRSIALDPQTAQGAAVSVMPPEATPSNLESARRRVSDLAHAGFVADSGARRLNPGSPDPSIVWEVTEAGWVALDLLDETGWSCER